MSKQPQDADATLPDVTPEPEKRPSTGPWDPFRYLIKTISPQQRAELWRLQVPILPQEEFMTTHERRRARFARLRRPAIAGASALLVVLALVGAWRWGSALHEPPAPAQPVAADPTPTTPRDRRSASASVFSTPQSKSNGATPQSKSNGATPQSKSNGAGRLPSTAEALAAVAPIAPVAPVALPPAATESPSAPSAKPHPSESKARPAVEPALTQPAASSSPLVGKPKGPDLETPW